MIAIKDIRGGASGRTAQVPVFARVVLLQGLDQPRYVHIVVIVEMAEPSGKVFLNQINMQEDMIFEKRRYTWSNLVFVVFGEPPRPSFSEKQPPPIPPHCSLTPTELPPPPKQSS